MKSLGLYLHIPYCYSKCFYCDFNSYSKVENTVPAYFKALKTEIDIMSNIVKNETIKTVFIGGGTPTFVDSSYICDLLEYCNKKFNIVDAEVTIESNPGLINAQKVNDYLKSGVNRVSIGLQSKDVETLKTLGRTHTFEQFDRSYACLRKNGIDNINIDLIFGVPNQSIGSWIDTVEYVIKLQPEHISAYSLKIEDSTILAKKLDEGLLNALEDEIDRVMYHKVIALLEEAKYSHYEISNFALENRECKHNINYWKCGEYLGIGAGAHGYLNRERYGNVNSIGEYVNILNSAKRPISSISRINDDEMIVEFIILGLRMNEGISIVEFNNRFNHNVYTLYNTQINSLVKKRFVILDENRLKLTIKGMDLMNQVLIEFI